MKNAHGKLEAIWIKRFHAGPMDSNDRAVLKAGKGLVGNADQGGKRQVTIIEKENWARFMEQLDSNLEPSTRRANLMISGLSLIKSRGRILQIGQCRVRVYGETKPCNLMDAFLPGLKSAMKDNWGGGAFAEIMDDGEIAVGDSVYWLE